MQKAQELYKISQEKIPQLIDEAFSGTRQYVINQIKKSAERSETYYVYVLGGMFKHLKEPLLDRCKQFVGEFEDNGYKVYIYALTQGNIIYLHIVFSWDISLLISPYSPSNDWELIYKTNMMN